MKRTSPLELFGIAALFTLGLALRLRQYLSGRSLWLDEAMLALNIIQRDLAGLLQPLDFNQGAPIGFLLTTKSLHLIFGRNELVLRLLPLLAGLATLWLFYLLLKQVTQQAGLAIALACFAVNPQMIYYSSEFKQYMLDVAVTLGLVLAALAAFQPVMRPRSMLVLGATGLVAVWFSHPAVFVTAGIGLALVVWKLQQRAAASWRMVIVLGTAWLANLTVLYFVNLRQLQGNSFLTEYWTAGFAPIPPWSAPGWFVDSLRNSIQLELGIVSIWWLAAACLLMGWLALWRAQHPFALLTACTILIAYSASMLRLYPVQGRLALFLLPLGLALLGVGIEQTRRLFSTQKTAQTMVTLGLAVLALYNPLMNSMQDFIKPKLFEHMRPYMDYLSVSRKDGDVFFVSYWAEPAFLYYAPFYNLEDVTYITSYADDYNDPQKLFSRLEPLAGARRVWVLFSHVYERDGFNEMEFMLAQLNDLGSQTRQLRLPETSVYLYLYDLGGK
jgi:uncharacterized membrane protein